MSYLEAYKKAERIYGYKRILNFILISSVLISTLAISIWQSRKQQSDYPQVQMITVSVWN